MNLQAAQDFVRGAVLEGTQKERLQNREQFLAAIGVFVVWASAVLLGDAPKEPFYQTLHDLVLGFGGFGLAKWKPGA